MKVLIKELVPLIPRTQSNSVMYNRLVDIDIAITPSNMGVLLRCNTSQIKYWIKRGLPVNKNGKITIRDAWEWRKNLSKQPRAQRKSHLTFQGRCEEHVTTSRLKELVAKGFSGLKLSEFMSGPLDSLSLTEKYKQKPMVYFLINNDKVVYIGKTIRVGVRAFEHKYLGKKFDSIVYWVVNTSGLSDLKSQEFLSQLESLFLGKIITTQNRQYPPGNESHAYSVRRIRQIAAEITASGLGASG